MADDAAPPSGGGRHLGPDDDLGPKIKPGEYILSIDGEDVSYNESMWQPLQDKAGRELTRCCERVSEGSVHCHQRAGTNYRRRCERESTDQRAATKKKSADRCAAAKNVCNSMCRGKDASTELRVGREALRPNWSKFEVSS